jgi:tRNA1Val (adenine37-N6)-methyltransferase
VSETTKDKFLGGRIVVQQPAKGFRAGLDAVMLAAAIPAKSKSEILELGTGVGTASLCLASRVAGCGITGVEIDAKLVDLAIANAKANKVADRVTFVEDDVFQLRPALRHLFDHVMCNPPFHDEKGMASPNAARDRALRDRHRLRDWFDIGLKRTTARGTFTAIVRADRLKEVIGHLPETGVSVFPLWPKPVEPAKRVIVQVRKGVRSQSVILPGLVLHDDHGKYTPEADAVLRGERALSLQGR